MNIRQATIDDLEAVNNLFDKYRIFYRKESDKNASRAFLRARFEEESSVIFLVEDEMRKVLGFTQLYPIFSSTQMKRIWLLNDLFVAKEGRGKGLSKLLIERVKQFCQETNAAGFSLETEKSNMIGNKLYPSAGMKLDDQHNYFYWDKSAE